MTGNGIGRAQWLVLPFSMYLMACGGKAPQTEMHTAQSAVQAAEVGGAPEIPKGKLHLKFAREEIAQAAKLMEDKDYKEARRALERAEIDARYALALANYQAAKVEAEELMEKIEEMMGEAK